MSRLQQKNVHCQILLAGLLVSSCGADGESVRDQGQIEFELEGQPLTFQAGVARQPGAESGQSRTGPQISGHPRDESAWSGNNIALSVPTLDPGSWEYDGALAESVGSARYPRVDLLHDGIRYRCYPGIAPVPSGSASIECSISVTGRLERVTGTFSGTLAEVDDDLLPTANVVRVALGEFDVPELIPPPPDDGDEE